MKNDGLPPSSLPNPAAALENSISSVIPSGAAPIAAEGAGRVRINLGIPNEYSWHASKQSLTFAKVKDSVQDRVAVFAGT